MAATSGVERLPAGFFLTNISTGERFRFRAGDAKCDSILISYTESAIVALVGESWSSNPDARGRAEVFTLADHLDAQVTTPQGAVLARHP